MMQFFNSSIGLIVLVVLANIATGEEIAFTFEGIVFQSSQPYGLPTEPGAPVTGRLVYDTDAAASHQPGDCDCVGYRQQIVGGFSASFGGVRVRADDYVVQVVNNAPQANDAVADLLTIVFADNLDPALTAPLVVDGMRHSMGEFSLHFRGEEDVFHSTSLPTEIDFDDFPIDVHRLADSTDIPEEPPAPGQIFFTLESLSPSSVVTGDYNFDGQVDDSDFDVWKASLGSEGNLSADGNRNGVVDAADFTVWRDAKHSTFAVPEPRTVADWPSLGSVLMLFESFRRRCMRRRNGILQAQP